MSSSPDPFELAIAHLSTARFREAAAVCDEILQSQPNHIDALNLSAILLRARLRRRFQGNQF